MRDRGEEAICARNVGNGQGAVLRLGIRTRGGDGMAIERRDTEFGLGEMAIGDGERA